MRHVGAADKAAIQLVRLRLRRVDELASSRSAEVKSSRIPAAGKDCSDNAGKGHLPVPIYRDKDPS